MRYIVSAFLFAYFSSCTAMEKTSYEEKSRFNGLPSEMGLCVLTSYAQLCAEGDTNFLDFCARLSAFKGVCHTFYTLFYSHHELAQMSLGFQPSFFTQDQKLLLEKLYRRVISTWIAQPTQVAATIPHILRLLHVFKRSADRAATQLQVARNVCFAGSCTELHDLALSCGGAVYEPFKKVVNCSLHPYEKERALKVRELMKTKLIKNILENLATQDSAKDLLLNVQDELSLARQLVDLLIASSGSSLKKGKGLAHSLFHTRKSRESEQVASLLLLFTTDYQDVQTILSYLSSSCALEFALISSLEKGNFGLFGLLWDFYENRELSEERKLRFLNIMIGFSLCLTENAEFLDLQFGLIENCLKRLRPPISPERAEHIIQDVDQLVDTFITCLTTLIENHSTEDAD
jgi:hypothetical protein